MSDHLKNLSQVYLEQIAESAVPGKPAEKLKTDRAGYSIPKADQMSAAERIKKKTAEKKAALEKKHGKKMDDHPEYPNKKYVDEADMSGAPSIKDAKPAKKTKVKYDPHMKVMAPQVEKEEVENVEEVYKGKHGQSDKEYADSRSQGGKMVSGDSKQSGAEYTHGRRVKAANPGMQPDVGGKTKPKSQGKMDKGTRAELVLRKANLKKESLDPVGKEDADVDNDGKKNDSNDKYIMKRREAIRKAIAKKKVSEQLGEELVIEVSGEEKEVKIKEKKVNNKITINPELKESISEIGGEVLFISEVDEVDSIAESVHIELIEEGYSEEMVVEAIKYAIDEVTNPAKVASFKMKKAKYTPKPETKEEPKKSLKDRIKSVAKKALDKASETAGKIMKKKAEIQAAPAKAKKKLSSYVDRAKAVAKAGYERGRGPVEKKPTTYRGAGVGRREKIGEEAAIDPKMQQLQKKQIMLDRQKLSARVKAMQKKKPAPEQAQEELSIDQQMKISRDAAAKRKPYKDGDHQRARAKMLKKPLPKDTRTDAQKMTDATGPRPGSRYRGD
jgi:hypothetical protein